jgi:hypothetical protein
MEEIQAVEVVVGGKKQRNRWKKRTEEEKN